MSPNLNQRGTATVVALIFMALLAALAAGFGALVDNSIQVSKNEQAVARAQAAAESGMEVMKSYLTQISIPGGTTADQIGNQVESLLANLVLNDKDAASTTFTLASVGADTVNGTPGNVSCIYFPMPTSPTYKLHPNNSDGFRATITPFPSPTAPTSFIIAVTGTDGQAIAKRKVNVSFNYTPGQSSFNLGPFGNGITCYGTASLSGSSRVYATQPLDQTKSKSLSLAIAATSAPGLNMVSGTVIGDASYPTHLLFPTSLQGANLNNYLKMSNTTGGLGGVQQQPGADLNTFATTVKSPADGKPLIQFQDMPPIPDFNVASFSQPTVVKSPTDVLPTWKAYTSTPPPTNTIPTSPVWDSNTVTLNNVTLPASYNGTSSGGVPKVTEIAQKVTVTGVLYIQWPNNVVFDQPVTVQPGGCIIFGLNPNPSTDAQGKRIYGQSSSVAVGASNTMAQLRFTQTISYVGSSDSTSAAKGYSILAPDADLYLSNGPTTVNLAGAVVVARAKLDGNTIINLNGSSLVVLSNTAKALDGSGSNTFNIRTAEGTKEAPVTLGGGSSNSPGYLRLDLSTYSEGS